MMTDVMMDDQILTVEDVASYLKLSEATIYRMAQDGKIPAKRVGRSWRFSREQIQEWFREQGDGGEAAGGPVRDEVTD